MFGKLMNLRNRVGRAKAKSPATRNRYRPRVLACEERVLLSTWTWDISTSGNWNNSANWQDSNHNHGIPRSGDTANLPGGGLTVTVSDAETVGTIYAAGIANNGILEIANGGSLTIDGDSVDSAGGLQVDSGGTLNFGAGDQFAPNNAGGGINGTLVVGANANVSLEAANITGTITAASGSQVKLGTGNSSVAASPGAALNGPGQYEIIGVLSAQTDLSVQNLTLAGGNLTGTNNVTVTGTMTDTSGFLGASSGGAGGTLTIAPGATMTITGGTGVESFSLDNFGTVTYSGSGGMGGASDGGAIFNNESGGVVQVENSTVLFANGNSQAGIFNNLSGSTLVLNISAGDTATCFGTFNNAGTVQVIDGELLALNGGTQAGAFQVASEAQMSFNGGQAWNVGISFSGVSGSGTGTFHVGAFSNYGNTTTTVTTSVTLPNLTIDSNNDVFLASGATLTVTGTLNLGSTTDSYAGIVDGAGNVVIPSGATLNMLLGKLSTSGTTTIASGGTMDLINPSALPPYEANISLSAGTLDNSGTVNWSGAGNFGILNGASFNNLGTFNDAYDAGGHALVGSSGPVFTNSGTYSKSSATGGETDPWQLLFNNNGLVNVNSGILNLLDGTNAGTFDVLSGATLSLNGNNGRSSTGDYTLNAGSTLTVAGNLLVEAEELNVNAATSLAVLDLESQGQLNANAAVTITKAFTLGGGTLGGSAAVTLAKTGTLTITEASTPTIASGTTLDLLGKTFWEGNGTMQNLGTINNEGGAAFTIEGNEILSSSGTFNNGGSLTSSGSSTTSFGGTFNDAYHAAAGTVTVKEDTLSFTGAVGQISGSTLTAGKWIVDSNTSLSGILNLPTSVTIIAGPASVTLNGPHSSIGGLSGLTTNQGSFSLLAGASFVTSGDFINLGKLTLAPVKSGSTLSVTGNFSNSSAGVLTIDLAGTSAKPTYGTISASGNIALAGTLNLSGSVKPNVGLPMNILMAGSSGTITGTFNDMTISYKGMQFSVSVSGNDVTLERTA